MKPQRPLLFHLTGYNLVRLAQRTNGYGRHRIKSTQKQSMSNMIDSKSNPYAHLYSYSSGRFLYNEELRLAERYVEFNVAELKKAVESCIDHGRVSSIYVYAEGGFNRVFLLTMEDGFEIIAKIPYSTALPKHYATASEVATLEFLRSKDIPVPEVFDWSSQSSDNAVGVEYIIMEKASGIGLDTRWFEMTKEQNRDLVSSFIEIEPKLFAIPFGSYGSIYFKKDVPQDLQLPLYQAGTRDAGGDTDRYCIGPIADYMFWYGKRGKMPIQRGPWTDATAYLLSIGQRESQWTSEFGKPVENKFPFNSLVEGKIDPEEYSKLLSKYLAIAPYLLPSDHQDPLNRPTLRHPDLTPRNILICPDTHKIKCIIDWQHATILPVLLVAGQPPLFENPDPIPPPGLEKPTLPPDYDSLSGEEKIQADELYRRRILYHLYRVFNGVYNKPHMKATYNSLLFPRQHLVDRVGRQWSGNLVTLRGALIHIVQNWQYLGLPPEISCPVTFTESEIQEHAEQAEAWQHGNAIEQQWRQELGNMSEEGWVRTGLYDDAVAKNKELKETWRGHAEEDEERRQIDEGWPFQDHEEVD